MYAALTSNDVLAGTEPTSAEVGAKVDAEIAELGAAFRRGDIELNLPPKATE